MKPIATALLDALAPLCDALSDPHRLRVLLRNLGWEQAIEPAWLQSGPLKQAGDALRKAFTAAEKLVIALEDGGVGIGDLRQAFAALRAAVNALDRLDEAELPEPLRRPKMWQSIARALPNYLLLRYLERHHNRLYALLRVVGIITDDAAALVPHPESEQRPYVKRTVDWGGLVGLVRDPLAHLKNVYRWGSPDVAFAHERLLDEVAGLATAMGVRIDRLPVRDRFVELYFGDVAPASDVRELAVLLLRGELAVGYSEIGLVVLPVPAAEGGQIDGLILTNLMWGRPGPSGDLGDGWVLRIDGALDGSGVVAAHLRPGTVTFPAAVSGRAEIAVEGKPAKPWRLLGADTGPRLEVRGLRLAAAFDSERDGELVLEARTLPLGSRGGVALTIDPGDDPLTRALLANPLEHQFDLPMRWSSKHGLTFGGAPTLDLSLPANVRVGPVLVQELRVSLGPTEGAAALTLGATAAVALGPVALVVENLGVRLLASKRDGGDGILGSLDLDVAFKPPDGVGLAIDASVVAGSGYLWRDEDDYAGMAELRIANLTLGAVGLLSAEHGGWSLIVLVSAKFPPIQLGYGFTLSGAGGLFAVNRTIDTGALQVGIKQGTLDSLMFPENASAAAPRILSDLAAVFPAAKGQCVFGPMLRIGWGTPTLITGDIAVVIELPDPIRIALLGQLAALLPDAAAPLVELHVDVVGIVDPAAGTLAIDATLRNSRIATYGLSGNMAVRAAWAGQRNFTLAIGGFNPRYAAPPDFPRLDRVTLALDLGGNPRVSLGGYLAITSNSVQFGARLEIWAKKSGITIDGHAAFDVFVTFSPFRMVADLDFGVRVEALGKTLMGVDLDLTVSGPKPWEIEGKATFEVCLIKKSFRVHETLPPRGSPPLPPAADVAALVAIALADPRNWRASTVTAPGVAFSDPGAELAIHPAATVEVRQRIAPLGTEIDIYGAHPITGAKRYDIDAVTAAGSSARAYANEALDLFAPGQYFRLSKAEKLGGPAFVELTAGIAVGAGAIAFGTTVMRELEIETILVDPNVPEGRGTPRPRRVDDAELRWRLKGGAATKALAALPIAAGARAAAGRYAMAEPLWAVVKTDDLKPIGMKTTWVEARRALASHPTSPDTRRAQVVPAYEARWSR
jgi:hypothetical protein